MSPAATPSLRIPEGLDATLVLVRHGESVWLVERRFQGQGDSPLTERGERQAALAGARLADPAARPTLPVPRGAPLEVVHSLLARTSGTARAIAAALTATGWTPGVVRPDAGLLEIAQGEWEGLHRDEIARRYGDILSTWRRRPLEGWAPGGESVAQVQERLRPVLEAVLARLAEDREPGTRDRDQVAGYDRHFPEHPWSILVGHDGVFKVAMLTIFDLPLERFWMWTMDLAAISVIEFRGGQPVLRAHDLTGHLEPLVDEDAVLAQEERGRSGAL